MGKFTDLNSVDLKKTLAQRLIGPVDSVRDLATRLGARPYKVRIVRVQWSSGQRGEGVGETLTVADILPTPKLTQLDGVREIINPVGLDEAGSVKVIQISGRFTENDLRGYDADGDPPNDDTEVFYEIEFPQPNGRPSIKRRFLIEGAPEYLATACQWQLALNRAHDDRDRQESPT